MVTLGGVGLAEPVLLRHCPTRAAATGIARTSCAARVGKRLMTSHMDVADPTPGVDLAPGVDIGGGRSALTTTESSAAQRIRMVELMLTLHRRVHDEESLLDLLARAAREAVRLIDDADWAGVTVRFAGEPFTAAHTDRRVLVVDQGQYGQGDGPCLAAMRTDQWVVVTGAQIRPRWPYLAPIAEAAGVRAYLATPLHAGDRAIGSLNLYSARADGLRTPDDDVLTVLTGYLDRGLTDYIAAHPGQNGALTVQHLLRDRRVVAHAADILMMLNPSTTAADAAELITEHTPGMSCPLQSMPDAG